MFFLMLIGAFEKHAMRVVGPMQIDRPFFKDPKALEILTSWPTVILGELIVVVITCLIFDKVRNKKLNIENDYSQSA